MSAGETNAGQEALMAALYKRNVAKDRLVLHQQECPVCNRLR